MTRFLSKDQDTIAKDYDNIAEHYKKTRNKKWIEASWFSSFFQENTHVLDIGCGTGRVGQWIFTEFSHVQYTGIDISKEQLHYAKVQVPQGNYVLGSMADLPFEDETFDTVCMMASLHHGVSFEERSKAIKEAYRVLKKGGILCMTNWNLYQYRFFPQLMENIWRNIYTFGSFTYRDFFIPWKNVKGELLAQRYYYGFTKRELKKLSNKAHFKILKNIYARGDKISTMPYATNIITILQK